MPQRAREQELRRDTVTGGSAHIETAIVRGKAVDTERARIQYAIDALDLEGLKALHRLLAKLGRDAGAEIRRLLLWEDAELTALHFAQVWQISDSPGPATYELEIEKPMRKALLGSRSVKDKAWSTFREMAEAQGHNPDSIWRVQCFERAKVIMQQDGRPIPMFSKPQKRSHNMFMLYRSQHEENEEHVTFLRGKECIEHLTHTETEGNPVDPHDDDVILFLS